MANSRPKYIKDFVESANESLRLYKVKDDHKSDLFWFIHKYLTEKKTYRGYNFFKDKYVDGKRYSVLAGSCDPDKFDYIQFY